MDGTYFFKGISALVLVFFALCHSQSSLAGDSLSENKRPKTYTTSMHNQFSDIASNYAEKGAYYFSDTVNSFGYKEPFNYAQEVLFCGANDRTFSDAVRLAAASAIDTCFTTGGRSCAGSSLNKVRFDSTSVGPSPTDIEREVRSALLQNSNNNSKGRFCYRLSDSRVDYKNPAAASATYCQPGSEMVFSDTVSGFSCGLKLDITMKVGETRYLRQLQGSRVTIAQGFVGCYANPTTGAPQTILVANPQSCSPSNRESCLRTCDWADEVVCDPRNMPRWGGNKCGAFGTMLFKGDTISVNSSDQLSFDNASGKFYRGAAKMSCSMVNAKAAWVVSNATCTPN